MKCFWNGVNIATNLAPLFTRVMPGILWLQLHTFHGLMQDRSNSFADALELPQSGAKPVIEVLKMSLSWCNVMLFGSRGLIEQPIPVWDVLEDTRHYLTGLDWYGYIQHHEPLSRCKCRQDSVGVRRILVVPRDSDGASTGFCWCILSDERSSY